MSTLPPSPREGSTRKAHKSPLDTHWFLELAQHGSVGARTLTSPRRPATTSTPVARSLGADESYFFLNMAGGFHVPRTASTQPPPISFGRAAAAPKVVVSKAPLTLDDGGAPPAADAAADLAPTPRPPPGPPPMGASGADGSLRLPSRLSARGSRPSSRPQSGGSRAGAGTPRASTPRGKHWPTRDWRPRWPDAAGEPRGGWALPPPPRPATAAAELVSRLQPPSTADEDPFPPPPPPGTAPDGARRPPPVLRAAEAAAAGVAPILAAPVAEPRSSPRSAAARRSYTSSAVRLAVKLVEELEVAERATGGAPSTDSCAASLRVLHELCPLLGPLEPALRRVISSLEICLYSPERDDADGGGAADGGGGGEGEGEGGGGGGGGGATAAAAAAARLSGVAYFVKVANLEEGAAALRNERDLAIEEAARHQADVTDLEAQLEAAQAQLAAKTSTIDKLVREQSGLVAQLAAAQEATRLEEHRHNVLQAEAVKMNREFLSEVHRLEEGLEGQKFENEQLRQAVEERREKAAGGARK